LGRNDGGPVLLGRTIIGTHTTTNDRSNYDACTSRPPSEEAYTLPPTVSIRLVLVTVSRNSSLDEIKGLVKECLGQLYAEEGGILKRNNGRGVCERSIVFRFAHYLQNKLSPDYFVDCDFNSSFERGRAIRGKPIGNVDRFVDIIVHKRDSHPQNDLICLEIKKWNNTSRTAINKDENNLRVLTYEYRYKYGFHISIHKVKTKTRWTIFEDGRPLEGQEPKVFEEAQHNRN